MNKRKWEKPQLDSQLFAPQASVAVCFSIYCTKAYGDTRPIGHRLTPLAGGYYDSYNPWYRPNPYVEGPVGGLIVTHVPSECGNASHYSIRRADPTKPWSSGNVLMKESGFNCNIYWSRGGLSDGVMNDGDLMYWTTSASDGRVWYHYGYLKSVQNRS